MEKKHKLIIGLILLLLVTALLANWKDFKAGLLGNPPQVEVSH